jgi:hypothetical protein
MKVLLISGIIYLLGVALVLWFKPDMMFREDGSWKEFGIGRERENYTWFPFWLFILVWSIISYSLVYFMSNASTPARRTNTIEETLEETVDEPIINKRTIRRNMRKQKNSVSKTLTPGYYVLNKEASKKLGVPKYTYKGKNISSVISE